MTIPNGVTLTQTEQGEVFRLYELTKGEGVYQGVGGPDAEKIIRQVVSGIEEAGEPFPVRAHGVPAPARLVNGQWEGQPLSQFPELQAEVRKGLADGTLEVTGGVASDSPAIPRSDSQEANNAIGAVLLERNFPTSTQAAGRAGWEAAFRWLVAAGVTGTLPANYTAIPTEPSPELYGRFLGRVLLNMDKPHYERWERIYREVIAALGVPGTSEIGKRSTSAATASGHELPNDTAVTAASLSLANGGDARVASAGCPPGVPASENTQQENGNG